MNIQANYWWGEMHCGPPKQNFGWAMARCGQELCSSPMTGNVYLLYAFNFIYDVNIPRSCI